jgi:hypothetical protein
MVQRGQRALNIAAEGYAGVEIRVDVRSDAHCDVELKPAPPRLSRIREDRFFVNDATYR